MTNLKQLIRAGRGIILETIIAFIIDKRLNKVAITSLAAVCINNKKLLYLIKE